MLLRTVVTRTPLCVQLSTPNINYRCGICVSPSSLYNYKRAAQSISTTRWIFNRVRHQQEQEASEMASRAKVINPSSLVNCHLQVIGTGNCELSPSLCLFTDSRRYIFNCGENFQRFTREYRVKLLKEPSFFITHVSWRNLGGLPGFVMSYRDSGKTQLHVHGPGRIAQFAEMTRYFIGRDRFKLVTNWESSPDPSPDNWVTVTSPDVYKDENVTITIVELEPQPTGNQLQGKTDTTSSSDDDDAEETVVPKPKRIRCNTPLPPSTAAFVCKLVDTKGKFNPERAKQLGLERGPIYKKLVAGESVTAPDGRVIHPSDVIGAVQAGPTFVVVECPNKDYISSVASHPKLQMEYFSNLGQEVALIVHISPTEVLQDNGYCQWAAKFGDSTKHLILNGSLCPEEVGLRSLMKIQYPLYLMNSKVHHPPVHKTSSEHVDLKFCRLLPNSKNGVIIGKAFLKFHLKPVRKMGEDISDVLRPIEEDIAERVAEIQSNPQLASAIAAGQRLTKSDSIDPRSDSTNSKSNSTNPKSDSTNARAEDAAPRSELDSTSQQFEDICTNPQPLYSSFQGPDDAVVTFLGTGSAVPSVYRNVSGILVQTPNGGNFLLDCGEGSLSQIYRCYPRQIADEIVLNLKAIFISHIHGDHNLGLVNVLQKKEQLLALHKGDKASLSSEPTLVIAPLHNASWLERYRKTVENLSYRLVNCFTLVGGDGRNAKHSGLEEFSFETVPVIHCSEAYGVVVRHSSEWSIVYSGDTRPCPELIEAGRGATLLIHEATLEDSLMDHAIAKKHCTVSEALEVSDKMNPDFTILTHFSQRYPRIPWFLMADQIHSRVAVAFDCMSVNLKQLDQLHSYLPTMRDIFAEVVEMDSEDLEPTTASTWEFAVPS